MPNGIPISKDSETATSISESVCMLSSHNPASANDANANSVMSAARTPPKRSTSTTPAIVVPAHVIQSSSRLNHSTRWSIEVENHSKSVKTNDVSSAPRSVRIQVWKLSRCSDSSFQTSELGHGYSSAHTR